MANDTKTKTRRKPARKRAVPEVLVYVMAIDGWAWRFSFGVRHQPGRAREFTDFRHIRLSGHLAAPLKMKGRAIHVSLVPSIALNEGNRDHLEPPQVGSLYPGRGHLNGILSIPADVLPALLTMFASERLRYLTLVGTKPNRQLVDISDYTFDMIADGELLDNGSG